MKPQSFNQVSKNVLKLVKDALSSDTACIHPSYYAIVKQFDTLTLIYNGQVLTTQSLQDSLNQIEAENITRNELLKEGVELEIKEVTRMNTIISYPFLQSIQSRAILYDASNLDLLNNYMMFHLQILTAKLVLTKPYNKAEVDAQLNVLKKLIIDRNVYPALFEEKEDVEWLLNNYCEKYEEVAVLIRDTKVLSDNDSRNEELNVDYLVKGFPFLLDALAKARTDRNFSLEIIHCEE
ncbi:MAG: hypothetical protein C0592_00515 [Marinilabiliales bacterium]|nr:MAG: hypothetical protein C0592_00515 [Marinilabiliales bacterium]